MSALGEMCAGDERMATLKPQPLTLAQKETTGVPQEHMSPDPHSLTALPKPALPPPEEAPSLPHYTCSILASPAFAWPLGVAFCGENKLFRPFNLYVQAKTQLWSCWQPMSLMQNVPGSVPSCSTVLIHWSPWPVSKAGPRSSLPISAYIPSIKMGLSPLALSLTWAGL